MTFSSRISEPVPPPLAQRHVVEMIACLSGEAGAAAIDVSVVIPVFNGVGSIGLLLQEVIRQCVRPDRGVLEIVVVDDGSTDGTWAAMCRACPFPGTAYRALQLSSNRGKTAALAVGFAVAAGRVVVTIDGDPQDDPAGIPALLAKLDAGFDLVVGWRRWRSDLVAKRFASWLFNRGTALVSGLALHHINCGLKGMRAEVAKSLRLCGQQRRFIPQLAERLRFRVTEVPVRHRVRRCGISKYGMGRCVPAVLDLLCLVCSSKAPHPTV